MFIGEYRFLLFINRMGAFNTHVDRERPEHAKDLQCAITEFCLYWYVESYCCSSLHQSPQSKTATDSTINFLVLRYIGYDEDMVATSLGFVCHFVTMLAHYLNVPLRYPLTPMGSRAFVLDPVSLLVGPKE